jgi:hypothetical protein
MSRKKNEPESGAVTEPENVNPPVCPAGVTEIIGEPATTPDKKEKGLPAACLPARQGQAGKKIEKFIYVGPSLPAGRLKSNTILEGTHKEITEHYKDAIELYPNVARLIIPVSELSTALERITKSGNLMNKYCTDIAADLPAGKAGIEASSIKSESEE